MKVSPLAFASARKSCSRQWTPSGPDQRSRRSKCALAGTNTFPVGVGHGDPRFMTGSPTGPKYGLGGTRVEVAEKKFHILSYETRSRGDSRSDGRPNCSQRAPMLR